MTARRVELLAIEEETSDNVGGATMTTPLVLTVEQAAERLGVGRTLMYALVKNGDVESVTIGRLRRVPTDALDAFVSGLRIAGRRDAA